MPGGGRFPNDGRTTKFYKETRDKYERLLNEAVKAPTAADTLSSDANMADASTADANTAPSSASQPADVAQPAATSVPAPPPGTTDLTNPVPETPDIYTLRGGMKLPRGEWNPLMDALLKEEARRAAGEPEDRSLLEDEEIKLLDEAAKAGGVELPPQLLGFFGKDVPYALPDIPQRRLQQALVKDLTEWNKTEETTVEEEKKKVEEKMAEEERQKEKAAEEKKKKKKEKKAEEKKRKKEKAAEEKASEEREKKEADLRAAEEKEKKEADLRAAEEKRKEALMKHLADFDKARKKAAEEKKMEAELRAAYPSKEDLAKMKPDELSTAMGSLSLEYAKVCKEVDEADKQLKEQLARAERERANLAKAKQDHYEKLARKKAKMSESTTGSSSKGATTTTAAAAAAAEKPVGEDPGEAKGADEMDWTGPEP